MQNQHHFDKRELKIIGFLSLLFVVFLLVNHTLNYRLLKETIHSYENSILMRVSGKLTDWLDERFTHIEKVKYFLEKSPISTKDELRFALEQIKETSLFPYLVIGIDDGAFITSEDKYTMVPTGYDPRIREWYRDTLKMQKTNVTRPYVSLRVNQPTVSVCTPVHIFKGEGVVCGGHLFEVIQQYISSYDLLYDKALYLVDENGIVLASSNHHKDVPNFLHVETMSSDFLVLKIPRTNWNLIFEKNQAIYSERLNIQLFMNLFIYGGSIALYIFLNLFWLSKNRKVENELSKQKNYFHDFMQNHTSRGLLICDSHAKIVFCNHTFMKLLNLQVPIEEHNFHDILENLVIFESSVKTEIRLLIAQTQESMQAKYLNIGHTENGAEQLLLTSAPFGSHEKENSGFLLYLQDTTEMQSVGDEQKTCGDVAFNAHIEKLLLFIEKNVDDERLDINKLAHVCGYSKYHLQRIFKTYCGENIASYLRRLRMEKSAFLLKYSEDKISAIATRCGFSYNQSYIRAFEKAYALSPSDFRDHHITDMHTSLVFERHEYELVELSSMKMLHIYNTMSDKALSNVEDLFENCRDLAKNEFPLVGIYMNDPKLSLAEVDSVMPYAFGVILDETQPQTKKNFPIKEFGAGKYAKVHFDPSKNDLDEFIQKIYTTFYKANTYEATILPILQFHHTSRQSYLEDFAQSSDFFIFITS